VCDGSPDSRKNVSMYPNSYTSLLLRLAVAGLSLASPSLAQGSLSTGGAGVLSGSASGSLSTTNPSGNANGVFVAFASAAEALKAPELDPAARNFQALCSSYQAKFLLASGALAKIQRDLADPSIVDAARQPAARRISAAVQTIRTGFEGIAADMADCRIGDELSFWVASDGYQQLAGMLPNVHATLADTVAAAVDASNALSDIVTELTTDAGDPFAVLFDSLASLAAAQARLANAVAVDDSVPAAATTPRNHCDYGQFRGCTNYRTITYTAQSCGTWGRITGGITVEGEFSVKVHGVDIGGTLGTVFCPDGGYWTRTCTVLACVTDKCVCECYASRWDRWWAINGTRKTVTTQFRGCFEEQHTESEWECTGPPPATLPVIPDWKGFGDEMDC
jgi:hypothetical protein